MGILLHCQVTIWEIVALLFTDTTAWKFGKQLHCQVTEWEMFRSALHRMSGQCTVEQTNLGKRKFGKMVQLTYIKLVIGTQ